MQFYIIIHMTFILFLWDEVRECITIHCNYFHVQNMLFPRNICILMRCKWTKMTEFFKQFKSIWINTKWMSLIIPILIFPSYCPRVILPACHIACVSYCPRVILPACHIASPSLTYIATVVCVICFGIFLLPLKRYSTGNGEATFLPNDC